MGKFRPLKKEIETLLLPPAWPEDLDSLPASVQSLSGMEAVSPLLALLPRGGLLTWRAAVALGAVTATLAETSMEDARTVMRRCMWSLNEDSGNIGWGVPQAMGEILAASPAMAKEYGKIILSYVRNTGFADNYLDQTALRSGAYWAIGRFAPLRQEFQMEAAELLVLGLRDESRECRGVAAWGLGDPQLLQEAKMQNGRDNLMSLLRRIQEFQEKCEVWEAMRIRSAPCANFARETMDRLMEMRRDSY